MKLEYDFSPGEQGKFYHSNAKFNYSIYLEPDVEKFITKIVEKRKIDVQIQCEHLPRDVCTNYMNKK